MGKRKKKGESNYNDATRKRNKIRKLERHLKKQKDHTVEKLLGQLTGK